MPSSSSTYSARLHVPPTGSAVVVIAAAIFVAVAVAVVPTSSAFSPPLPRNMPPRAALSSSSSSTALRETIVSPFDAADSSDASASSSSATTYDPSSYSPTDPSEIDPDDFLDLTLENVEMVLDEMRPFLIQDGGNVAVSEIDGPVVRLELQVSCHRGGRGKGEEAQGGHAFRERGGWRV